MKKLLLAAIIMSCAGAAPAADFPQNDTVFSAMRAELDRTMTLLAVPGMPKPYFTAYFVSIGTSAYISASFGALVQAGIERTGDAGVDIRVGNYQFDSSNVPSYNYMFDSVAFDPNDLNIRHSLWLSSNRAYVEALKNYSQKKAFVSGKNLLSRPDDMLKADPVSSLLPDNAEAIDMELWKDNVRQLSGLFKKYPAVMASSVSLAFGASDDRFLNSEGSFYKKPNTCVQLLISASGQDTGGEPVSRTVKLRFSSMAQIPDMKDLSARAESLASELTALSGASKGQDYVGPVLLENSAAAEFLNDLFVKNISNTREWLSDEKDTRRGAFTGMMGLRVLPVFFTVTDDPSLTAYQGQPLIGAYALDDEAVPAGKLTIVKRGKLTDFYVSRAPVREHSFVLNGHGRGISHSSPPQGMPGNVLFDADESSGRVMRLSKLKLELVKLCRRNELDYGIIVREMPYGARGVFSAYRIYVTDGHEEPVNSLEFSNFNSSMLREIAAVSKERQVHNMFEQGVPYSIVAPAILVEDAEIKVSSRKPDMPPYLAHPYFDKTAK